MAPASLGHVVAALFPLVCGGQPKSDACNAAIPRVTWPMGRSIPETEKKMGDIDVWHSIRFFVIAIVGLTALGIVFFAVA
jgi:hypothetical protein